MPKTNEQLCLELRQGRRTALNELVEGNLPFVRHEAYRMANQYRRVWLADDLIQEGLLGLMEAAERFEPEKETRFLTYAVYWVRKRMREYLDSVVWNETVSLEQIAEAEEVTEEAISYSGSPERIVIQRESAEELYHALQTVSPRERAYLWFRFGFLDEPENRTRKETADHFHLIESRAKSTEETALDNVRLELPWWYG